jgi:hypothetical protein
MAARDMSRGVQQKKVGRSAGSDAACMHTPHIVRAVLRSPCSAWRICCCMLPCLQQP